MKALTKFLTLLMLLILVFLPVNSQVQTPSIEDILKTPATYQDEMVEVTGWVPQFIDTKLRSTSMYILRGDKGGSIRIHTAIGFPETLKKYRITGVVYNDAQTNSYFISEKSRVELGQVVDTISKVESTATNVETTESADNELFKNILIFGGGALLLLLFAILIIVLAKRRKKHQFTESDMNIGAPVNINMPVNDSPTVEDFKTIRIFSSGPKTMKFIPGELRIISGDDAGKSFKIAGYPTAEGNIVTIGRASVTGDREFAHIQLRQKTVSHDQAQLIQKDGKLFVKNLSKTNYTQVDGVELQPGESIETKPNSTIRVGEVEFQYVV